MSGYPPQIFLINNTYKSQDLAEWVPLRNPTELTLQLEAIARSAIMLLCKFFSALLWTSLACEVSGAVLGQKDNVHIIPYKRAPLQDIVTWDEKSIFVRGERIMLYSGEFHPFRLPVPSLWLDVFQKLKAAGFNAVSFYVHWVGLLRCFFRALLKSSGTFGGQRR